MGQKRDRNKERNIVKKIRAARQKHVRSPEYQNDPGFQYMLSRINKVKVGDDARDIFRHMV